MRIKNAFIYPIAADITPDLLDLALIPRRFYPCLSSDVGSSGFAPPREGEALTHPLPGIRAAIVSCKRQALSLRVSQAASLVQDVQISVRFDRINRRVA